MGMRSICVVTLLIACALTPRPARADGGPVYMTGAALLELLDVPAASRGHLSPAQQANADRAYRYMDGVHDATAGTRWCDNAADPPKPDTLYAAAITGLRALPPPELKRNAAELIVRIWSQRWPCHK